jgi:hypothetical protein
MFVEGVPTFFTFVRGVTEQKFLYLQHTDAGHANDAETLKAIIFKK